MVDKVMGLIDLTFKIILDTLTHKMTDTCHFSFLFFFFFFLDTNASDTFSIDYMDNVFSSKL